MDDQFKKLLSRTPLNIPFDRFIKKLQPFYPQIGEVTKMEPIFQGYEDANIKIRTTSGAYVLKIFSRRERQFILDYVHVLNEAEKLGIPIFELVKGSEGTLSIVIGQQGVEISCCLSVYFDGYNFENTTPSPSDIKKISGYLAHLNTLNFPINEDYDSWGNRNFLAEFEKQSSRLSQEQLIILNPIVQAMKLVDYSNFKYGVIHGDMQRKHVLKKANGDYCIIDFGCMANAPVVFEISILFAWFCFAQDTWPQHQEIVEMVIGEYKKWHTLSDREVAALPTLTRAAYAAYYLKTSLLVADGDHSKETEGWHENAKTMLALLRDWTL